MEQLFPRFVLAFAWPPPGHAGNHCHAVPEGATALGSRILPPSLPDMIIALVPRLSLS
jgi:hypothetical protein